MMIAYGYPEFLDPTPADGMMMALSEFRKELEAKYADNFDNALVVNDLREHLSFLMEGAPPGALKEIFGGLENAGSMDEVWNILRDSYNRVAERYMERDG
jgi:hypothetical protein